MNSCFHPNTHPLWIITHQIRVTYFYLSLYSILPGPLPVFSDSHAGVVPPPRFLPPSTVPSPWHPFLFTEHIAKPRFWLIASRGSVLLLFDLHSPDTTLQDLWRYVIIPPEINFKTNKCNKCGLLPTQKHPWKHELTPKWVAGNSVSLCRGARSMEASAVICEWLELKFQNQITIIDLCIVCLCSVRVNLGH